ncbi:ubiquinol-cytochrome C reductase [Phenylobacterium sp. J426]|uniref:ubiquinol-cytochrome C chaperone family protein n=1 Tax=Phenylobacterium sp. J426 TaxID=2898439 RepID=UPI002151117B|nr:ubiquinol-cytochrome C chaperone family protein [Phenylobacterium sp. J426]MCR5875758.1 ubiquinol-cytochrome C reductase [Phenylobacterium sp. J426]
MLKSLFKPKPARTAGRALYARVVEQARSPALYRDLGAPDTPEGRFEIYSLHVVLLLERLRGHGAAATEVSQALFDAYVSHLDDALRELGVGDMVVGKKMRKLGEAFYGRGKNYQQALDLLPDRAPLEAVMGRTVYAGVADRSAELADYVLAQREALAANRLEDLLAGKVDWRAA